jgi:hypothetical protein
MGIDQFGFIAAASHSYGRSFWKSSFGTENSAQFSEKTARGYEISLDVDSKLGAVFECSASPL